MVYSLQMLRYLHRNLNKLNITTLCRVNKNQHIREKKKKKKAYASTLLILFEGIE